MTYIRTKTINNAPYAYLVESTSTSSGSRQKVKKYLGRVHSFSKDNENSLSSIAVKNKESFVLALVERELQNHGFLFSKECYRKDNIQFSSQDFSLQNAKNSKDIVVAMNEGYLCEFTLHRLLQFKRTKNVDNDAPILAKHFLEAGIPITPEQFVQFYELL